MMDTESGRSSITLKERIDAAFGIKTEMTRMVQGHSLDIT